MNDRRRAVLLSAAVGVATGLLSTYPAELGPAVCLPLWAVVGGLVGALLARPLLVGTAYGVALSVAFLYSRFGGSAGDLPAYMLFVLVASVAGAAAGAATAWVGSRLRRTVA